MTRPLRVRGIGLTTVIAGILIVAVPSMAGVCLEPPGDINGDQAATIADVQCSVLWTLWTLAGGVEESPVCAPLKAADLDCSSKVDVMDVGHGVRLALGLPLDLAVDADGDRCVDACQAAENQLPVAVDDEVTLHWRDANAGFVWHVLDNDFDPDPGDTLQIVDAGGPEGAQVAFSPDYIQITPEPKFIGTVPFWYIVSDGEDEVMGNATALIYDQSPFAPAQTFDVHWRAAVAGVALDAAAAGTDPDPQDQPYLALGYVGVPALSELGAFAYDCDSLLCYSTEEAFTGKDTLDYGVWDGLLTGIGTLTINVYNHVPVATDDAFTIGIGGLVLGEPPLNDGDSDADAPSGNGPSTQVYSLDVLANDGDEDPDDAPTLSIVEVAGDAGGIKPSADGKKIQFTRYADQEGTVVFAYALSDGLDISWAEVTVELLPVQAGAAAGLDGPDLP